MMLGIYPNKRVMGADCRASSLKFIDAKRFKSGVVALSY